VFYQTPNLSLRVQNNPISRIHIIISKNTIKKSTNRNLIKRRIKSSIKETLNTPLKNKTLFFYIKKGIEKKKYKEIKEEIKTLLKKASF
jgi:ribonuclease P protein component